jgi:putative ABC transport system ATP-binding protein
MGIFQKLNTERGITVLLITHEREIAEYGTRIIAFRDGKIVSDKPNTVRRMAADEFAALPLDTDSDADSPVPAASTPVGALDLDLDLT